MSRWAIDTNEMFMHFQPSVCLSALSMDLSTFRKLVCNVDARQPILYHHLNAIMLKWKHHLYYGAVVVVDVVATRSAVWYSLNTIQRRFHFGFLFMHNGNIRFISCDATFKITNSRTSQTVARQRRSFQTIAFSIHKIFENFWATEWKVYLLLCCLNCSIHIGFDAH